MNFPIYTTGQIQGLVQDGSYEASDFANFVSELLDSNEIDDAAEIGILRQVNAKGTKDLSDKQSYILSKIVDQYIGRECNLCGNEIPLNEVLMLDYNDGYCSPCKNMLDKDD